MVIYFDLGESRSCAGIFDLVRGKVFPAFLFKRYKMMNLLKRPFKYLGGAEIGYDDFSIKLPQTGDSNWKTSASEALRKLTKKMRPITIACAVETICRKHVSTLMIQPMRYISSAVWGADRADLLDTVQMDIRHTCECLEKDMCYTSSPLEKSPQNSISPFFALFHPGTVFRQNLFFTGARETEPGFLLEDAGITWAIENHGSCVTGLTTGHGKRS